MAITHIGTTSTTSGSALSANATVPNTATLNRLIVISVRQFNVAQNTFTPPTGYTQAVALPFTTGIGVLAVFYKVSVGAADQGTKGFTSTTTGSWTFAVSIYDGQDTTIPVVATGSTNSGTMSTTSYVVAAVTMTAANSWLYAFYATNQTTITFTTGTMAERLDASGVGAADEAITASGSTGSRTITASASTSTAWATVAIGINPAAAATATLTQSTFRGRNDDGSETTATWKATAGTDWTQNVDENFRVRFNIADSVAAATQNTAFILRYSLNGGAYTAVSASSSVVRATASPNVADGAATTEQLAGSGTFNAGTFDEVDGSATGFTAATATGQDTEVEYSVQIRGVDVANGDTVNLRVYDNAGAALNGGYTDTPIITVSSQRRA